MKLYYIKTPFSPFEGWWANLREVYTDRNQMRRFLKNEYNAKYTITKRYLEIDEKDALILVTKWS